MHSARKLMQDHPRARGEQPANHRESYPIAGSSPRARGAAQNAMQEIYVPGIIPARAGSRRYLQVSPVQSRDHPRARGEQWLIADKCPIRTGSSPRARGAVDGWDAAVLLARDHPRARGEQFLELLFYNQTSGIIPARAGSRPKVRPRAHDSWDHPRARGAAYCSFFGVTFRSPSVYRSISHRCVLACGTGADGAHGRVHTGDFAVLGLT